MWLLPINRFRLVGYYRPEDERLVFCAHCGVRFIQNHMAGVLVILHEKHKEHNVITRINIPTGKTANVFTMLKWLNILRRGNLKIARDVLHNIEALLIEIRNIIVIDNEVASRAFRALGARIKFCQVALPQLATPFEQLNFTGEYDQLILGRKGGFAQKHFFDIYGALTDPNAELNKMILLKVATLVLRCMTVFSFSEVIEASKDANGNQIISRDAVKRIYHWRQTNTSDSEIPCEQYHIPRWTNGDEMTQKDIDKLRAEQYPDVW